MKTPSIIKRFRQEVKNLGLKPNSTITLNNDLERASNTKAAGLLLKEVFHDRVEILEAPEGLICGSREEAAATRLQEYTENKDLKRDILLSSLLVEEIETYLKERTNKNHRIYVPESAEVRLIERLAEEHPEVRRSI